MNGVDDTPNRRSVAGAPEVPICARRANLSGDVRGVRSVLWNVSGDCPFRVGAGTGPDQRAASSVRNVDSLASRGVAEPNPPPLPPEPPPGPRARSGLVAPGGATPPPGVKAFS